MKETKVLISPKSVLIAIGIIGGVYLAYLLRGIIVILFIAFIINAGLRPFVNYLDNKKRVPRSLAILAVYIFIFAIFILLGAIIVDSAVDQVKTFLSTIDQKVENFISFINNSFPYAANIINIEQLRGSVNNLENIQGFSSGRLFDISVQAFNALSGPGLSIIGSFIGGAFSLIITIILSIYMLQNRRNVYEPVLELLPEKYSKKLTPILTRVESSLGSWLLGQGILMLVIGVGVYIVLLVPSLFDPTYSVHKYALIVAIIAFFMESIPNIGPTIIMIVALLIAIGTGASVGILIYIFVMFILLQQLEALLVVPVVMKKAVDLHPIVTIISVIAGFELGGTLGALLAVPVAGILQIIIYEVSKSWKKS